MLKEIDLLSDQALLAEMGQRLSRYRLQKNLTQEKLAKEAGVSKRTLERLEAGESVQLTNFIRVLRRLGRLPGLEQLLPKPLPSPMAQLQRQGQQRQRASTNKVEEPKADWSWGD